MPLDANGNVVITKVPLMTVPTGFKGIGISTNVPGVTVNGKPATPNYNSPSHGPTHLHGNWGPAPAAAPAAPVKDDKPNYNESPPSHSQTNSPEFIRDTYDPTLGYERHDSPGDNPYISNYRPVQHSYMNDPSTLSAEELDYRKGNIKGLDDRQNSIENAGALMNDYIFNIKENLKGAPTTSVGTVGRNDLYGDDDQDDDKPYSQFDTSNYY